jgi:hypothetical protein
LRPGRRKESAEIHTIDDPDASTIGLNVGLSISSYTFQMIKDTFGCVQIGHTFISAALFSFFKLFTFDARLTSVDNERNLLWLAFLLTSACALMESLALVARPLAMLMTLPNFLVKPWTFLLILSVTSAQIS